MSTNLGGDTGARKMKAEEANKIIAEYMGDIFRNGNGAIDKKDWYRDDRYLSLDALVPVWDHMGVAAIDAHIMSGAQIKLGIFINHVEYWGIGSDYQEAACIATAKCIQELEK